MMKHGEKYASLAGQERDHRTAQHLSANADMAGIRSGRLGRAALTALSAAALIAVLSACSGGSRTGEPSRPAEDSVTETAEAPRPPEAPAAQSGSVDEPSRPPETLSQEENGTTPTEGNRPEEPTVEPENGGPSAEEQRRPDSGEAAPESVEEPTQNEAPRERSRPEEAAAPRGDEADSGESGSAQEQTRPETGSRNEPTDSSADSSSINEKSRPKTDSTKRSTTDNDKISEPSKQTTPKQLKPEQNRPTRNPDWKGPDNLTEQSRDGSSIPGSGHYLVTEHMRPGLYRSAGRIDYWERTSGLSGTAKDRIASASPAGPTVVEIKASDTGFISKGPGTWKAVSGKNAAFKTEFGAGTYVVGTDLAPGRYKSVKGADSWAVLAGFGGEPSDVLLGSSSPSDRPLIIEITKSAAGFTSRGALWTKID